MTKLNIPNECYNLRSKLLETYEQFLRDKLSEEQFNALDDDFWDATIATFQDISEGLTC